MYQISVPFMFFKLQSNTLEQEMCNGTKNTIEAISQFYTVLKQYGEKLGTGKELPDEDLNPFLLDTIPKLVAGQLRNLTWYLGQLTSQLLKIEEEKEEQKGKDQSTAQKNAEKRNKKIIQMVVQSNLLSGGIEQNELGIFSEETKTHLKQYALLMSDHELIKNIDKKSGEPLSGLAAALNEPSTLEAIITEGLNEEVDMIINSL
mmetsp:Transcript_41592/g.63461  ORF Transcript_41592/g.63461 Transcript_41592/m.63461 type:complete len:204 (+) Transcript_41592:2022-2633(+)